MLLLGFQSKSPLGYHVHLVTPRVTHCVIPEVRYHVISRLSHHATLGAAHQVTPGYQLIEKGHRAMLQFKELKLQPVVILVATV